LTDFVEIKETTKDKAKAQLKEAKKSLTVPMWSPKLVNGRWRALKTNDRHLEGDRAWMTEMAIDSILSRNLIADQRDIFYVIRTQGKNKTIQIGDKKYPLKDEKVYNLFIGDIMENVQLLADATQQSMGVRPGPRGFIFSQDGVAYVPRNNITYRLDGQPSLSFDLAGDETKFQSMSRKIIHFEKAAGFEGLVSGDISKMLETIFSTSQGQLTEASHKFLAKMEADGRRVYAVHDADPYGLQMLMLYGLASKNNAYMPSSFYAKHVTPLGLLPSIAKKMDLPPEDAAENAMKLAKTNLTDMVKARPEFQQDLDTIIKNGEQWEFQSLNGVHEMAPQIYLAESLRAMNDEIKYVPAAKEIKDSIVKTIKDDVQSFVSDTIAGYVNDYLMTTVAPDLKKKLTEMLEGDIAEFTEMMEKELPKLDKMKAEDLREAVKLKLVENPTQYFDRAIRQVVKDILNQKFVIEAKMDYKVAVPEAEADKDLKIGQPTVPDKPLTKDDIVASIEQKMIRGEKARTEVVGRIRPAVEARFGKPNQEW
jgi:DNA topoisomerase VI subunit A